MKNPNAVTEMEEATPRRPTNLETIRQRAVCRCGKRLGLAALALLVFAFFTCLPLARAVSPPPDGCYPGLTTAEGCNALFSLTNGQGNTAIGHDALFGDSSGSWNTGVGAVALGFNDADFNTAVGTGALFLNTTGSQNTANGALALLFNTDGSDNTAMGFSALRSNTHGFNNTATGENALYSNTEGHNNTASGYGALTFNIDGNSNTATGVSALNDNTHGHTNTATGAAALAHNTIGGSNTATGGLALSNNTTGNYNTANGEEVLFNNTEGSGNTAAGWHALFNNSTAMGGYNTAYGYQALLNNTTGSGNTALGFGAGIFVHTAINVISIGAGGDDVDNSCYIGNIWAQSGGTQAVYVNSAGKLGFQASSRRFKDEIKPMEHASEVIYSLKPVTFRYKADIEPARPVSFGLIAEDVEEVSPDLVARGDDGKVNTVRYDQVNAMLLNEFLKEHRTVQEQQREIDALRAELKDQKRLIQRVNEKVELSRPAPRLLENNP